MENTPAIKTDRLFLRRFQEHDAEAVFLILNDQETNRFLPWFPIKDLGEAKKHLKEYYLDYYRVPSGFRYAICLQTSEEPIGYLHVSDGQSHDLGYGLRREFWHQGIATEACRAVLAQLAAAKIPYVTATHDILNPRSGEVMKKIGMSYRYSYLEQWQPKNIPVVFRMYQLDLNGKENPVFLQYWKQYPVHFIEDLEKTARFPFSI